MKHLIIAVAVLSALSASAQIGAENIIKARAHNVANQNNNRDVDAGGNPTTTPTAAKPAAPPAPATTPLNPAQQAYAHFQSDLLSIGTNSPADMKDRLAKDMTAVPQGANKPSQATVSKLSDHLTTAMTEAKLAPAKKTRIAQDVAVLLNNNASVTPAQRQAMIKDVQSILETGGASSQNASAVAADLQTVVDEVQKPAAK
jgi:hypothetical protein